MVPKSEISIPTPWTFAMEKELLELYLDGMDIVLLSSHLNLTRREVVRKLSGLLFGLEFPTQNPDALNYQKTWSWAETSRLWRMYAVGIPVQVIAHKLGRDELGICYRLLTENLVVVPATVVEKYKLDEENFATDSDQKTAVKICSVCLDVVPYCKCDYEE